MRVGDVENGKELPGLVGAEAGCRVMRLSTDGRRLLTARGTSLRVWDFDGRKAVYSLAGYGFAINDAALSGDGRRALFGSADHTVRLLDVDAGKEVCCLRGHTDSVVAVALSPDGKQALSSGRDGTVRLWDIQARREMRQLEGHTGVVQALAFSPNARWALSGASLQYKDGNGGKGKDLTVRLWDLVSGREWCRFEGHTDAVFGVAFSPDGRRAASASWDGTVRLWGLPPAGPGPGDGSEPVGEVRRYEGHQHEVRRAAFAPDGRQVLSACWDKTVRLFDARFGREIRRFEGHVNSRINGVLFCGDGRQVLSCCGDATIRLWQRESGESVRFFERAPGVLNHMALSPDDRWVAAGGQESPILLVWDLQTGVSRRLGGHTKGIECVCFSPRGTRLACGCVGGPIRVWDSQNGELIRQFRGHVGITYCVKFTPDGRFLVSTGQDQTIRIWDVEGGKEVRCYRLHKGSVMSVALSLDGRRALSAGADRIVRLWDVVTGKEIHRFEGHTAHVWDVGFSPDQRYAVSAGSDRTLRLWRLPDAPLILGKPLALP